LLPPFLATFLATFFTAFFTKNQRYPTIHISATA
jgi:hypothetical protein